MPKLPHSESIQTNTTADDSPVKITHKYKSMHDEKINDNYL